MVNNWGLFWTFILIRNLFILTKWDTIDKCIPNYVFKLCCNFNNFELCDLFMNEEHKVLNSCKQHHKAYQSLAYECNQRHARLNTLNRNLIKLLRPWHSFLFSAPRVLDLFDKVHFNSCTYCLTINWEKRVILLSKLCRF